MTGVTWTGSFPRSDYEIRFEAARLAGNDFFATVTFPVQNSFCSLVTGGWGGDIVGLVQHRWLGRLRQRDQNLLHVRKQPLVCDFAFR